MKQPELKMNYLLSYKLSQDHLENFFSSVRDRGGHNDNPTAFQFMTAYKRLLVHHEVRVGIGAIVRTVAFEYCMHAALNP